MGTGQVCQVPIRRIFIRNPFLSLYPHLSSHFFFHCPTLPPTLLPLFPCSFPYFNGADTRYSDTILLYGAVYMHAVYYTSLYYSLYCTLYKLYTIVDSNILCHTIIYTKRQAYYIDCKPQATIYYILYTAVQYTELYIVLEYIYTLQYIAYTIDFQVSTVDYSKLQYCI